MTAYEISTDGYRSAEGVAAWAFVATTPDGARHAESGRLDGDATSHLAEWVAVHEALAWAERALDEGDVALLRTDSALVAKGLASRRPSMSGEAAERRAACRQALARLGQRGIRVRVARVGRETNVEADGEARRAAGVADA